MDRRNEGGVLRVVEKEVCENKKIEPPRLLAVQSRGHRGQFREQGGGWVAPEIALMIGSIKSLVGVVDKLVKPNLPERIFWMYDQGSVRSLQCCARYSRSGRCQDNP